MSYRENFNLTSDLSIQERIRKFAEAKASDVWCSFDPVSVRSLANKRDGTFNLIEVLSTEA